MTNTNPMTPVQAWYVEERINDAWAPVVYYGDKPTRKRTYNVTRKFREEPVKVEPVDADLPLSELKLKYGSDTPTSKSGEPSDG